MKKKGLLMVTSCILIASSIVGCSNEKKVPKENIETSSVITDEKNMTTKKDAGYRKISQNDSELMKEVELAYKKNIILNECVTNEKNIDIKNKQTGEVISSIDVQDPKNLILEIVVTDDFCVWSEMNYIISGDGSSSERPEKIVGKAYYKNLKTQEIKCIEEELYNEELENVVASDFEIKENNLIYRKFNSINDKSYMDLIYYNLNTDEKIVITDSNEEPSKATGLVDIGENSLVYTEYSSETENLKEQNIIMYDIETKERKTILENLYVDSLVVSNDNVVVNINNSAQDSIYCYNIKKNETDEIFYKGSKIKEVFDNEQMKGYESKRLEVIDDRFLSIEIIGCSKILLYDFKTQEFLESTESYEKKSC
ncbi:MAG: hypothetical protein ACRCWM_01440 [Sarcina sp.]